MRPQPRPRVPSTCRKSCTSSTPCMPATHITTFVEEDYEIAETMSSYWANFAKTLNPNHGGSYAGDLPRWEPNTPQGDQVVMELGDALENIEITSKEKVDFVMEYFSQQISYYGVGGD
ncbi:hypothetical protein BO71DRAFT_429221 [Aspergillus ellipticus CBS 707.79]|uniref:Carboxylesterase type B domain-containing protein n=1 Tax=Aspergillus ellipticus CBS 707.79 TaxID=1448320 RepID=A0A319DD27_9EURO|nr:hypothetical protein BO71DRAFT_429221 [Aspergillus ellipticus CBS 707.79]